MQGQVQGVQGRCEGCKGFKDRCEGQRVQGQVLGGVVPPLGHKKLKQVQLHYVMTGERIG